MIVRYATENDLEGIMIVETESFGSVNVDAMASRNTMSERIKLVNVNVANGGIGWFIVAESKRGIEAYLSLQPTSLLPDECISWESSTDSGTFRSTFDPEGKTIFGASLAARKNAEPAAVDMLVHRAVALWVITKKARIMFCSRLPGMRRVRMRKTMSPEQYAFACDKDDKPIDPLLSMFYGYFSVKPYRFLPNGFSPDSDSEGHAALIVVEDPTYALMRLPELIYESAFSSFTSLNGESQ